MRCAVCVPAVGGLLLAVALMLRGSDLPVVTSAPPRACKLPVVQERDPGPSEQDVFPQRSSPARDPDPSDDALPEGDLLDLEGRLSRRDEIREAYLKFRSAVACDDPETAGQIAPLLLLDRDASLEFAREDVSSAQTGLDYEIARKTQEALKTRITLSESQK